MRYYTPELRVQEEELGFLIARYISSNIRVDCIEPVTDGLSDTQAQAVYNACTKNISLLRGYAGTGKSTVIKRIIASYLKAGMKGAVFCPTGKASKRVKEILNDESDLNKKGDNYGKNDKNTCADVLFNSVKVCTIHMGLGPAKGSFIHNEENTLQYDFIVIDEATMGGLFILNRLLRALNFRKTRIVLTGDENQLPSVDSGNVFYDLVRCKHVPSVYLTEIFRQGENSGIVHNAARILKGEKLIREDPKTGVKFTDIEFIKIDNSIEAKRRIIDEVTKKKPLLKGFNPLLDIQTISPGTKGDIGTISLNDELRASLNKSTKKGFCNFMLNDKVINRKNDYNLNVVNGDVGLVVDITKYGMTVNFGSDAGPLNNGKVEFTFDNMMNVKLAYCYTVHSSQGSQYKSGVIPIYSTHYMLLYRNLLYTAMTRFSEDLTMFYQGKALAKAIRTEVTSKRKTALIQFIEKYLKYSGK